MWLTVCNFSKSSNFAAQPTSGTLLLALFSLLGELPYKNQELISVHSKCTNLLQNILSTGDMKVKSITLQCLRVFAQSGAARPQSPVFLTAMRYIQALCKVYLFKVVTHNFDRW